MLEKAYIRFRENLPDNQNTHAAAEGFAMQGVEIVPFYGFGDINLKNMPELGERAIICGNIGDVWEALKAIGKSVPTPVDYPEHLRWMLGREVQKVTLEEARGMVERKFLKPVQQKLFTGFIWDPSDPRCRLNVAVYPPETPCWVAEEINIVSEWRCFIKHHAIVGVKHYKGDWTRAPSADQLGVAVTLGRAVMPNAYCLDLGVTDAGKTILVEATEGYAVGCYGLASLVYARFLETRWEQLLISA